MILTSSALTMLAERLAAVRGTGPCTSVVSGFLPDFVEVAVGAGRAGRIRFLGATSSLEFHMPLGAQPDETLIFAAAEFLQISRRQFARGSRMRLTVDGAFSLTSEGADAPLAFWTQLPAGARCDLPNLISVATPLTQPEVEALRRARKHAASSARDDLPPWTARVHRLTDGVVAFNGLFLWGQTLPLSHAGIFSVPNSAALDLLESGPAELLRGSSGRVTNGAWTGIKQRRFTWWWRVDATDDRSSLAYVDALKCATVDAATSAEAWFVIPTLRDARRLAAKLHQSNCDVGKLHISAGADGQLVITSRTGRPAKVMKFAAVEVKQPVSAVVEAEVFVQALWTLSRFAIFKSAGGLRVIGTGQEGQHGVMAAMNSIGTTP